MDSTSTSPRPVAIVTGGSRGIGRAVALSLARQGWDIAFSYAGDAQAARQAAALIEQAGGRALGVQADVASPDDTRRLFAGALQAFGRLDALVNNAGVTGGRRSILEADAQHLRGVFDTNVIGSFLCAAQAARIMSTQRGGRGGVIVNMSSTAARLGGMPEAAHYAASKGAIDGFTIALAKELAPHGIRVNAVRPGLIATEIHAAHGGQALIDQASAHIPLGRAGTPDEVGEVVAFLCDARSSYVHGALIDISGGR